MPTPQNGQTHSNNSSATADELLSLFDHFMGLPFKGLISKKLSIFEVEADTWPGFSLGTCSA